MTNFDSINLLPRHVAVNYLKVKSDTDKVHRTASSIGFICKSFIYFMFYFYCLFRFLLTILLSLFSYLQLHLPYFLTISE